MVLKNLKVNDIILTNEGYFITITNVINNKINIKFLYNSHEIFDIYKHQVLLGQVKNPFHPSIHGVGFLGVGKYKAYINRTTPYKVYAIWEGMIRRCYNERVLNTRKTYKGVTVCEEWHNFQNFAEWYEENYKDYIVNWQLDKDILSSDVKTYSPETCCFIPVEINSVISKKSRGSNNLPSGVSFRYGKYISGITKNNKKIQLGTFDTEKEASETYEIHKKKHIEELATEFKGLITEKVYKALMNYNIQRIL